MEYVTALKKCKQRIIRKAKTKKDTKDVHKNDLNLIRRKIKEKRKKCTKKPQSINRRNKIF